MNDDFTTDSISEKYFIADLPVAGVQGRETALASCQGL